MRMAAILAEMPDLRRRFLAEHAPDRVGRCRECRSGGGPASEWPCLPYRIALEAQRIADGHAPASAPPRTPRDVESTHRRLKAVPAASWAPRW